MKKTITALVTLTLPVLLAFSFVKKNNNVDAGSCKTISLVTFKGIQDGLCFFTDTDSVVKQYKIGEHEIIERLCINRKNYIGNQFIISENEYQIISIKQIENIDLEY